MAFSISLGLYECRGHLRYSHQLEAGEGWRGKEILTGEGCEI